MKRLEEKISQLKKKIENADFEPYDLTEKIEESLEIINDLQAIMTTKPTLREEIKQLEEIAAAKTVYFTPQKVAEKALAIIKSHIPNNNLVSNCCGASEYHGVIDKYNTGRCSKCGDGAGFINEDDFN